MYEMNVTMYLENEQIIYFPVISTTICSGEDETSVLLVTENNGAMQRTIEVLIASGMLNSVSTEYLFVWGGSYTPRPKFTLMITVNHGNSSCTIQFNNCLFSNSVDYNKIITGEDDIELEVISFRSLDKQVIQY